MPHLTFIIPIRHPENASDWSMTQRYLASTARSIAAQSEPGWHCVVVANETAELPDLPEGFSICRVSFPPNQHHSLITSGKEVARDAVRLDKGRRVLAGMLSVPDTDYFMVVDDDDFISSHISGFVLQHAGKPGWQIDKGYGWSEGARHCIQMNGYSGICGSSLIIRADLYDFPTTPETDDPAEITYIKDWLGSHVRIKGHLKTRGTALQPLPFPGGIYRVGHSNSHSGSSQLWQHFFLRPRYLRRPAELVRNLFAVRKVTDEICVEFFGGKMNEVSH